VSNEIKSALLALAIIIMVTIVFAICGCVQHIADVTITEDLRPDGTVEKRIVKVHGGHTAVAADSKIGKAIFSTPSGWDFELWDFSKYLDSLDAQATTGAGIFKLKTTEK
jgi:hypothetical protein